MRKSGKCFRTLVMLILCATLLFPSTAFAAEKRGTEMRAVWVATVLNIDFPRAQDDAEAQKQEIRDILDNAVQWGLDTVIMQVCPTADALYRSEINPWSAVLTGTQGKDPGYDPLAFMIDEAHRRGLKLHAWINPYRVTHSTANMTLVSLTPEHPARRHPEWVIEYEGGLYYNPALPEVKRHVADTVAEIVQNYDVDGIHFDDYFYPTGYPLPEGEERDGAADRKRREDVNDMIRMVKGVIDASGKDVVFGISPFGIWKNSATDPAGSETAGNESYYSMSCDTLTWIGEEMVDYIAPQLYWETGHDKADYETLVAWWSGAVRGTDVALLIGQGVYKDEVAAEIGRELTINEAYPEVSGSIYFSYTDLAENRQGCADQIAAHYRERNQGSRVIFVPF